VIRNFESEHDTIRKKKAADRFVSLFKGSHARLSPEDVDYKIFNSSGHLIAYAEIVVRMKNMSNAYDLPIPIARLSKLFSKRLNPVVIWACDDGVIYGKAKDLTGTVSAGSMKPKGAAGYDIELIAYYPKQPGLKYVRFV